MRSHELDGFITRDLSSIYIDLELYDNIDRNFRARNTLAHEIGHLVLHVEYYRSSNIESVEDWKRLQRDNRELHNNLETQARMFAPCLLMPPDHLERLFEEQKKLLVEHGVEQHLPADTLIASYVASQIGRAFSVSEQSAEYRLKNWLERRG
ncbi:MAG: ImmA/IrrE family metallo-endopeptidase [SAR324 cluster bacterium]|nr:ImmA/IrrE family metallo-endopeptidase [SAR324 cluster bacterium]